MSEKSVITLPLERIRVEDRLRPVDGDYVELLAASFLASGQHTPIQVMPADLVGDHVLIAGAHRVAAARKAGLPSLQAIVFTGTADECRLLEIDENLMRRELTELDRAVFLVERKRLYEKMHPGTGRGGDRRSRRADQTEENFRLVPGQESFAAATAQKLGISERQVRTYISRASILRRAPEVREALASSPWADHGAALDELARVEDAATIRRLVAALTRDEDPAPTIRAAQLELGLIRDSEVSVDDAQYARLLALWKPGKTGASARDRFLRFLAREPATAAKLRALLAEDDAAEDTRQARLVAALRAPQEAA